MINLVFCVNDPQVCLHTDTFIKNVFNNCTKHFKDKGFQIHFYGFFNINDTRTFCL